MQTARFDYRLPPDLIAQEPAARREGSRMLVVERSTQGLSHRHFGDLGEYLAEGDLLVLNDTRVVPARLHGTKEDSGGKVELLLVEDRGGGEWDVLCRASRRPKPGIRIRLGDGEATAVVLARGDEGRLRVRLEGPLPAEDLLARYGEIPLPPYIRRDGPDAGRRPLDRERYQTVYAQHPGAVAAPTAGLHFTRDVLNSLAGRGVHTATVTLHVGPGTFRPVTCREVEDHLMEDERYVVPEIAAGRVAATRSTGGRVVAVGSTVVRTLETVAAEHGRVVPCRGRTRLFIHPPYRYRVVDALLTNFHLPRSTLLMMVCAFAGYDLIMGAYREAVDHGYRFYSYGDCMLIL